jgi:hypothetical protein
MIIDNISNQFNVAIGGPADICHYCLIEAAKEEAKVADVDVAIISERLKGKLDGKKIWRLRNAGTIVVCKDHIKKICELVGGHLPEENGD